MCDLRERTIRISFYMRPFRKSSAKYSWQQTAPYQQLGKRFPWPFTTLSEIELVKGEYSRRVLLRINVASLFLLIVYNVFQTWPPGCIIYERLLHQWYPGNTLLPALLMLHSVTPCICVFLDKILNWIADHMCILYYGYDLVYMYVVGTSSCTWYAAEVGFVGATWYYSWAGLDYKDIKAKPCDAWCRLDMK